MAKTNALLSAPPYAVEQALKHLGANLRTARVRRGLTLDEVSKKIGAGVRAVTDAENGKASTGVAIYLALLWAYDLLGQFDSVADPTRDAEGVALAKTRERTRARRSRAPDNDF
ncbi:MAG: helix-turn-helix domain-containing protein [Xanthobacteraceae bacterium]|nr:helix-turn-helix domain-containing protein [Xanthobacteraceae bacterium]